MLPASVKLSEEAEEEEEEEAVAEAKSCGVSEECAPSCDTAHTRCSLLPLVRGGRKGGEDAQRREEEEDRWQSNLRRGGCFLASGVPSGG